MKKERSRGPWIIAAAVIMVITLFAIRIYWDGKSQKIAPKPPVAVAPSVASTTTGVVGNGVVDELLEQGDLQGVACGKRGDGSRGCRINMDKASGRLFSGHYEVACVAKGLGPGSYVRVTRKSDGTLEAVYEPWPNNPSNKDKK